MKFKLVTTKDTGIALARMLVEEGHIRVTGGFTRNVKILIDSDVKTLTAYHSAGYDTFFSSVEGNDLQIDKLKGIELADNFGYRPCGLFYFNSVVDAMKFVEKTQKAFNVFLDNGVSILVGDRLETIDALNYVAQISDVGTITLQEQIKAFEVHEGCVLSNGELIEGSFFESVVDRFMLGFRQGPKKGVASVCSRPIAVKLWMQEIGNFLPRHSGVVTLRTYRRRRVTYAEGWTTRLNIPVFSTLPALFGAKSDFFLERVLRPRRSYTFSLCMSILPSSAAGVPISNLRKGIWRCGCQESDNGWETSGTSRGVLWLTSYGKSPEEAAKRTYRWADKLRWLGKFYRKDAHKAASKVFDCE